MNASQRKAKAAEAKAAAFKVIDLTDQITVTNDDVEFYNSVAANIADASSLKNKSLIRIDKRTYANSIIRRNSELTETAILDIALSAHFHMSAQVTLQMIIKFIAVEFKTQISRSRFADHISKNKYHKQFTTIAKNDVLRFKSSKLA